DAVARVHAEPDQVLAVGLLERLGAGHAAGDPAVAVSGVPVGLQFEQAALNHHVGGVPETTRVAAGLAAVLTPRRGVEGGPVEVVREDPLPAREVTEGHGDAGR